MRTMRRLALVTLALFCVAPLAFAQAVGSEFQINTYTTSSQLDASVAVDATGGFVVAWDSAGSSGNDASGPSVQARRYDSSGNPIGDEFQVNTFTNSTQSAPSVAPDATGGFVIAWESNGSAGSDASGYSIQARRYDSSGNPIGDDFQVNTFTTSNQSQPWMVADATGGFVIAWRSDGSTGTDSDGESIQARRLDSSGNPIGDEFQVNTYTTSTQGLPTIAADATGGFVIAWESSGSYGNDASAKSIQARRFDSSGNPIGDDFQVNTYTTNNQYFASVAVDAAGGFVVAWHSYGSSGNDSSGSSIQGRRFDSSGNPVGDDFQLNSVALANQAFPSVAADAAGGFVVAWQSVASVGGTDGDDSIVVRRFDSSGNAIGAEFQVNTFTPDKQHKPSLAAGPGGSFVVAWESYLQDGDNWGIFGQRLQFASTPSLSVDDVAVSESAGTMTFIVSLSFPSASTVKVKYKTANGTAMSGSDYTAKALTTLTFTPGQTAKSVTVTIANDPLNEDDEFFFLNLSAPTNAALGDAQGIGTIQDDDALPSLSINDASVTEGDSGTQVMTFTVTLSPASGRSVGVVAATGGSGAGFATAPSDYTAKTQTLTFTAGQTSKGFSVTIKGDTLDEGDEIFNVNLGNAPNATIVDGQGIGTILNNDSLVGAPSLSVSDATVTEGDSGTTDATFTISLSGPATQTVTVHYATANGTAMSGSANDYLTKSGNLTFPVVGSLSQNVTVKVNGDLLNEADETFSVNLSNPVQATILDGLGLGTIQDNDPLPQLSIGDASVTEGNSGTQSLIFTVTLSAASGQTVTVHYATANGSATAPSDYTAKAGTLTFSAGQTSKTITVSIKGDTLVEGDESFVVDLSSETNATVPDNQATGTIIDND